MTSTQMLNQDQTHFILECISYFMNGDSFDFTNEYDEVILSKEEINQLIKDLKDRKY